MIQIAVVETNKAERLMKALCNHFARKIAARYEGDKGYIDFGDATCEITAAPGVLKFQAQAETLDGLEHVRRAIGNHLGRFTPDENIQIRWEDPS